MSLSNPITPLASLSDQAFERLANAIETGEIHPGELIKEAAVARQLGISRGPLREAAIRLEARRVVERIPNVGVRVVNLSQEALRELFIMREALEGMACRLAATSVTDEELAELSELLERHAQKSELKGGEGYFQGLDDEDFHFRIVRASRNSLLVRTLCDELYHQVRLYRYRSSRVAGRPRAALEEHRIILEALRARDPNKAEEVMREHVRNALANLVFTGTPADELRRA